MFGCGVLWGRPCCAIAGAANTAAMPATNKIAFMFNLLFRIVGGGGVLIRITPADKPAFLMVSISQICPSGETTRLPAHLSAASNDHQASGFFGPLFWEHGKRDPRTD